MDTPRVLSVTATASDGTAVRCTVSTDIVDHVVAGHAFGRESLADPATVGRHQRRIVAVPDRAQAAVTPLILTLGNLDGLFLVRKGGGGQAGWTLTDLGATLNPAATTPAQVQAFHAAWTADDRVAVVVAVAEGAGSRVYAAYDLATGAGTTDWSKVAWTDCGTRPGVRVEGVRVLDNGDHTWTVVLVGDAGPNESVYLWTSSNPRTFADAVVFSPAVTMETVFDFAVGVHPDYGSGLHLLGTSGGVGVLTFRSFPQYDSQGKPTTVPAVVILPCPPGAATLDVGLTGPDGAGADLYVGGQGVQLITADEQGNAPNAAVATVVGADVAGDVQDVLVADQSDGSASVWVLRQSGDLCVTHRAGSNPTTWSNPLTVRSGVQEVAPVLGDDHVTTSVLCVYGDDHATCLWRDAGTGAWLEAPVLVADPAEATVVTCYGTSLRVLDAAGAARPGVTVRVSASVLSAVVLNGADALIGPAVEVAAVTDGNGGIGVFDRVRSLTPAFYRFSVDGVAGAIEVNPAGGVHERFSTLSADDLSAATVPAAGGPRPLLPDEFRTGGAKSGQLGAIAAALNQGGKLAAATGGQAAGVTTGVGGPTYTSALKAGTLPAGYRWGVKADGDTVTLLDDAAVDALVHAAEDVGHFFEHLGETISDFFEGIGHRIKDGLSLALHAAEEGYAFVCSVGDKIKKFALRTLEEAGSFFKWLWQQVKTGLEDLWNYLKFLFDWDDVLLVRGALVDGADQALRSMRDAVASLKDNVRAGFDQAEQQIDKWRTDVGAPPAVAPPAPTGQAILDDIQKATQPIRDVIDKVSGNSVVSWVIHKLESLMDDVVRFDGPNPAQAAVDAAESFVTHLSSDELSDLMQSWNQVAADLTRVFDGKLPATGDTNFVRIRNGIIAVGADALVGVLHGLRDFVLRTIDLMADLLDVAHDALFCRIEFPFIEKLVKLVAPTADVDASVRLVDGLMLMAAVPTTIGFKLMFGQAPLRRGESIPLPYGPVTVQSGTDDLKAYSWMLGLGGAFVKAGIADYTAFTQLEMLTGGAKADANKPMSKTDWGKLWAGAAFGGLGLVGEFFGWYTNKGQAVTAVEGTALTLSGIQTVKTVAVLIVAGKSENPKQIFKANGAIDVVLYSVHFLLRTAVFGMVIDQERKSSDSTDQAGQTPEALAWVEALFDQGGSAVNAAAAVDDDPETKAILLVAAGAGKALAFLLDLVRVLAAGKENVLLQS